MGGGVIGVGWSGVEWSGVEWGGGAEWDGLVVAHDGRSGMYCGQYSTVLEPARLSALASFIDSIVDTFSSHISFDDSSSFCISVLHTPTHTPTHTCMQPYSRSRFLDKWRRASDRVQWC